MIWADRLALVWAVIVYGVLALVGAFAPENPGASNALHALFFVIPPWVILRLLDLMAGGPRRRRSYPLYY